jgi:hypothetical protein
MEGSNIMLEKTWMPENEINGALTHTDGHSKASLLFQEWRHCWNGLFTTIYDRSEW